jgi:hypothetical protein
MNIKLELTLDEVNGILHGLGNMPFAQVELLIKNIRDQVIPQIQEPGVEN